MPVLTKTRVIGAKAVPRNTTNLEMSGQNPCPNLHIKAGTCEQILRAVDKAFFNQPRDMGGINLHQAVIRTHYFPGFGATVSMRNTWTLTAFPNRYGLNKKRINMVLLPGCVKAERPDAEGKGKQQ